MDNSYFKITVFRVSVNYVSPNHIIHNRVIDIDKVNTIFYTTVTVCYLFTTERKLILIKFVTEIALTLRKGIG